MAQQNSLSPAQIQKLNKMKRLNLNPAYGGTLVLPTNPAEGATVKCSGMEIKITIAEAFKL